MIDGSNIIKCHEINVSLIPRTETTTNHKGHQRNSALGGKAVDP
jgi:hypothetical protein